MWIEVTVNSCPAGKCWMGSMGVGVGVGGKGVGVSVGFMGVAAGSMVSVGIRTVRVAVAGRSVEGALQLTMATTRISIRVGKKDFNFTRTSCYQQQAGKSRLLLRLKSVNPGQPAGSGI
jgi:hypothetical protein